MGRSRTGSIWVDGIGAIYGRITWKDANGKRQERKRKAVSGTRREARRHIKELLDELEQQGDERTIDASTLTFKHLFDYYEREYAIPAEYDQHGIKKAGLRSWRDVLRKVSVLRDHFRGRVKDVSYGDLAIFKRLRLNTPVAVKHRVRRKRKDSPAEYKVEYHARTIASVNRELSTLRRVFTIAVQHKWLTRNPFNEGDPLINIADEQPRERIATKEERDKLLSVCVGAREHLRPFLILAFDCGFRAGEMFRLKVQDIDFDDNAIRVVSYKGKRRRERPFDMTPRLRREMLKLCEGKESEHFVFGDPEKGLKSVKRSFATAKRLAGMTGVNFRLHDARHTATTRLLEKGMTLSEAGKLMGHTQPSTTWRYMHADKNTRKRAAELLDED